MAKKFSKLRANMFAAAQAESQARAQAMLLEMPLLQNLTQPDEEPSPGKAS
jgi:hypothetical protein